jgi:uncharacterized protein YbaA (DUF1428 family)
MSYADGFVVPVPKKNLAKYKAMAKKCAKIWKEYGALSYVETIGDDVPKGKWTSFPRSVKLKPGEVVILSWITYPSRAVRDRVNKKIMKDPRLASMMEGQGMPFDGKRMIYGGFKSFITL